MAGEIVYVPEGWFHATMNRDPYTLAVGRQAGHGHGSATSFYGLYTAALEASMAAVTAVNPAKGSGPPSSQQQMVAAVEAADAAVDVLLEAFPTEPMGLQVAGKLQQLKKKLHAALGLFSTQCSARSFRLNRKVAAC